MLHLANYSKILDAFQLDQDKPNATTYAAMVIIKQLPPAWYKSMVIKFFLKTKRGTRMVFSPMELQAYFQTELDAGCLNGNGVNAGQKRSLDEAAGGNGAGSGGPTAAAGAGNGNWKGNGNGNRNRNGRRRAAVTQLLLCSLLMSHCHHHLSNQWPPCKLSLLLPPSITNLN